MRILFARLLVLFVLISSPLALAEEGASTPSAGPRELHRIGLFGGILSEPFPSVFSANIAYNALENLRLSAGVGTIGFGSNIGLGAHYLFTPKESFSPVFGILFSRTRVTDILSGLFGGPPSPDEIFYTGTAQGGIEWQTHTGFYFGLGVSYAFYVKPSDSMGKGFLPYLNIGVFF